MMLIFKKGDYLHPLPNNANSFDVIQYASQKDKGYKVTDEMAEVAYFMAECDLDQETVTVVKDEYRGLLGVYPLADLEDIINKTIEAMK